MKKFVAIFSMLAIMLMAMSLPSINAQAAENATYTIRYVDSENCFRFYKGSWGDSETVYHRELYYMFLDLKDGDHIVIYGNPTVKYDLTFDAKLGSLTIVGNGYGIVTAKSIDNVYATKDNTVVINGDVVNGHVYDNAICNFNNNVTNLYVLKASTLAQTVAVAGTVDKFTVADSDMSNPQRIFYQFKANALRIENGEFKSVAGSYQTAPPTAPATNSSSSEYDDVPKTGQEVFPMGRLFYLLSAAAFAICGITAAKAKKAM